MSKKQEQMEIYYKGRLVENYRFYYGFVKDNKTGTLTDFCKDLKLEPRGLYL
eukprot:gene11405-4572_t